MQCATRETRPCAWMVSCTPCADVTGVPAASESAVPPNSNLSKLFCVGVPTAASGDFACSVDPHYSVGIDPALLAHKLDPP